MIALAGSAPKCQWLKTIGADVALNYKDPDFAEQLEKASEGGFATFFDNIGGPILSAVLPNMKRHGRVAVCGSISAYNSETVEPEVANWLVKFACLRMGIG